MCELIRLRELEFVTLTILAYPVFPDKIQLTKEMLLLIEAFKRIGIVELIFILLLVNVESDISIFPFVEQKSWNYSLHVAISDCDL